MTNRLPITKFIRKKCDNLLDKYRSYSVFIRSDDFVVGSITFENSTGRRDVVEQALVVHVDGDRVVFKNCRFLRHQYTLL